MTEQYEKALLSFKQVLERAKKGETRLYVAHLRLAATYAMLDRDEEAKNHLDELLKIRPKYSIKYYAKRTKFKNQADLDRWINALRKAGLPE